MCLPDFIKFEDIREAEAVIGYRNWRIKVEDESNNLKSEVQNYIWPVKLVSHEVTKENSGVYSYNSNYNNNYYNYRNYNYNNYRNYNNTYYSNYNNNYNNYNYYNYNNNYYYNISGIIKQFGKVAIHKVGYRSEFAKVEILFTIREFDARGPKEYLDWIKNFNVKIAKLAERYGTKTLHYQDFLNIKTT